MSVTLDIRPATPADYPALAELYTRIAPDFPVQEGELRHWDANRGSNIAFSRLVVRLGDRLVAAGERGQHPWMFHPRKFNLEIGVDPEHRRRGIGGRLYDLLLEDLKAFDPLVLRARTREDRPDALSFLEKRGFVEEDRDWESRLEPRRANLEPFLSALERVGAAGIAIVPLADLATRDPEHRRKLYDLETETGRDAPHPDTATSPDFESWQKRFDDPNLLPEAYLVALDGDRYVGMTQFWRSQTPGAGLFNGFTGVARAYRGRGIASALKARNLLWARDQGEPVVTTFNNVENRAMLAINEALGFEKRPAWLTFVKVLKEEA